MILRFGVGTLNAHKFITIKEGCYVLVSLKFAIG